MDKPDKRPKALPKPDPKIADPTADEFESWTLHPVTRFVADAYQQMAGKQREMWMARSWGDADANPELLIELRTRADDYMAFLETGLDEYAFARR